MSGVQRGPAFSSGLSDAALDAIAHLAGVSRATVSGALVIFATSRKRLEQEVRVEPRDQGGPLSARARRLLSAACGAHAGEGDLVYFVQAAPSGRIKIGTTGNLHQRIRVLRAGSPVPLRIVGVVRGGRHMERMLHMAFAPLRWGRTEWFEPGESLLSYIRELHEEGAS